MSDAYAKKDTAERYDSARALPDQSVALWMETLTKLVPPEAVRRILDLGGGTGRFAAPIQKTYNCPVMVVDPSSAMLRQGHNLGQEGVSWICGTAEQVPLLSDSIDLVWMSQVFHHLENPLLAFDEIHRVLCGDGHLVVRNGTRESEARIEWSQFFPEARQIDERRIPSQSDVVRIIRRHGFDFVEVQTVYQLFASSYLEYCQKIGQRGLSSLILISDDAFHTGLQRLREWAADQPRGQPVYEPVDLFVFGRRG